MESLVGEVLNKAYEVYGDYARGREMRLGNNRPVLKKLGNVNRTVKRLGKY